MLRHLFSIALESSHSIEEKLEFQNQCDVNDQIRQKWIKVLGTNYEILVVDVNKPDSGGLGITLEGTIDMESGEEVRAHHYIRTLLAEGVIGMEGTLKSTDELLEVKRMNDSRVFVSERLSR